MFFKASFGSFVLVLALCIFGVSPVEAAHARPSAEKSDLAAPNSAEQKLVDATVNLYCRIEVGNKKFSTTGSGVFVDSRGVILTNAHVAQYFLLNGKDSRLKADCSVRTGSPAKESYSAEVLYISSSWLSAASAKSPKKSSRGTGEYDFAFLYVTGAKKGTLPTQFPALPPHSTGMLYEGEEVIVAGYPAGDLSFSEIRSKLKVSTASSTITSLRSFRSGTSDFMSLSASKMASTGVSGGPVAFSDAVAGIATAMSTSGTGKKKEETLRAITLPYIGRVVGLETGLPLTTLFLGDLSLRASTTKASISPETLKSIERPLRVTR